MDIQACTFSPVEPARTPAFMDLRAVVDHVALSASTVEQRVCEGTFPAPRLVSGHRVRWLTREVDAWCETQPIPVPEVEVLSGLDDGTPASAFEDEGIAVLWAPGPLDGDGVLKPTATKCVLPT